MKRFAGIFTPIVTPFRTDDTLDEGALQRNVLRWMQTPLTGLVVLGSNGEAPQLDDVEADRVVEIVRANVPRERPLIAGTGPNRRRRRSRQTRAPPQLVSTPCSCARRRSSRGR